jgi:hypothetical protein
LAPLVPSPRAAKRLVNLYRLVRARLYGTKLDDFLIARVREAPYRAVLLLLAILVGRPAAAPSLFLALQQAKPDDELSALLATVADARNPALRIVCDELNWLNATDDELMPPAEVATYQTWLPLVSRFSFTPA